MSGEPTEFKQSPEIINRATFFKRPWVKYLGAREAEMNYIIGVGVFWYGTYCIVPTWLSLAVIIAWNMLDAKFALWAVGTTVTEGKHNYRYQSHEKYKAVFLVLSAVGLIAFTCSSPIEQGMVASSINCSGVTAYAGIVFALAMMWDFLNAGTDRALAVKKAEFSGWLEETDREIRFLANNVAQDDDPEDQQRLKTLLEMLYIRCEARYYKGDPWGVNERITQTLTELSKLPSSSRQTLSNLADQITQNPFSLLTNGAKDSTTTGSSHGEEAEIQTNLLKNQTEENINLVFKCLSFVGMSLIATQITAMQSGLVACPVPGGNLLSAYSIGSLLVGIVAVFYILRFARDTYENINPCTNSAKAAPA